MRTGNIMIGSVKNDRKLEDEYNNLMDEIPSTLEGFIYVFKSGQIRDIERLDRTIKNLQLKISSYKKRIKEAK